MLALCWLILAYLGSNCPTWLNMASTWAQLSPTWPQLGSNLTPRDPPNLWFSYRKTIVLVFLQFLVKNGIRITLLGGWRGQVGAKLRPCWAKLGPTWGHVGTSWPNLEPNMGPRGRQKIDRKSTEIKSRFLSIFCRFSVDFLPTCCASRGHLGGLLEDFGGQVGPRWAYIHIYIYIYTYIYIYI